MIIEETAEVWKIIGRRSEIVAAGPRPGRMPTRVPMRTPRKQYERFVGVKKMLNPYARL
jgi:hypothetical protein